MFMDKALYSLHADMCKTFSSSTRLEILEALRDGPLSVSELVKRTGASQANVSQHLSVMKGKGVVKSHRNSVNVYYEIANPKLLRAFDIIREVLREKLKGNKRIAKGL